VTIHGKKIQKVLLDPLDREIIESKLDAITDCYRRLTTHTISLGFAKPSLFQQKIIDARANKN
jgi:hypothetical protein